MAWLSTITPGDLAIVCATILGPILAVQAQKWIERWRDRQARKLWVFQTLMSTRMARLSAEHVRALNMIDLVFYGTRGFKRNWRSRTEQDVLDKWKEYLDELGEPWDDKANNEARIARRTDLFTDLLVNIAADVRFKFDRVQLKKGAYSPLAHGNLETELNAVRKLALQVLGGERALKMEIDKIQTDPEVVNAQVELQKAFRAALSGEGALNVHVQDGNAPK